VLIAPYLPHVLALVFAAVALIIDAIAAIQTVRIKDLFDFIGGPFKYIEEVVAALTVGYDLADFAQEASKG